MCFFTVVSASADRGQCLFNPSGTAAFLSHPVSREAEGEALALTERRLHHT